MKRHVRDFAGFLNESREPGRSINPRLESEERLRQMIDRLPEEAIFLLNDAIYENPDDLLHIADSVLNDWADSEEELQRREYESEWGRGGRENYLQLRSRFEDLSPETLRQVVDLIYYAWDRGALEDVAFLLTRRPRMND